MTTPGPCRGPSNRPSSSAVARPARVAARLPRPFRTPPPSPSPSPLAPFTELLKRYIAYARARITPKLTDEAADELVNRCVCRGRGGEGVGKETPGGGPAACGREAQDFLVLPTCFTLHAARGHAQAPPGDYSSQQRRAAAAAAAAAATMRGGWGAPGTPHSASLRPPIADILSHPLHFRCSRLPRPPPLPRRPAPSRAVPCRALRYQMLRRDGRERKVVVATPRQLESFIRIAESLARMKLAHEVGEPPRWLEARGHEARGGGLGEGRGGGARLPGAAGGGRAHVLLLLFWCCWSFGLCLPNVGRAIPSHPVPPSLNTRTCRLRPSAPLDPPPPPPDQASGR